MNHSEIGATKALLETTAAALRILARQVETSAGLLVPPGKREWSGSSSNAFENSVREVHGRVLVASNHVASAARYASIAAGKS